MVDALARSVRRICPFAERRTRMAMLINGIPLGHATCLRRWDGTTVGRLHPARPWWKRALPRGARPLRDVPGQVVLQLRHPWADGTTALVFEPTAFLERLAVLVPRPRINLVLYHGVLAPRAASRAEVVRRQAPLVAAAKFSAPVRTPFGLSRTNSSTRIAALARPVAGTFDARPSPRRQRPARTPGIRIWIMFQPSLIRTSFCETSMPARPQMIFL